MFVRIKRDRMAREVFQVTKRSSLSFFKNFVHFPFPFLLLVFSHNQYIYGMWALW